MIHFIRKARRNLLSEKKFNKYLIYVVGEIILVVVGILIALQIDNWNENDNNEKKEVVFLKRLLVDLNNDSNYLDLVESRKQNKIKAANDIIRYSFVEDKENIIHLIPSYLELTSWQTFIPNQNTFKELISSGSLNILQNDSIKNGLLQLDRNYKSLIDWQEVIKQDDYIGNFWSDRTKLDPYNYLSVNKSLINELNLENEISAEQKNQMQKQLEKDVTKILQSYQFRNGTLSTRDDYKNQLELITTLKNEVNYLQLMIKNELISKE